MNWNFLLPTLKTIGKVALDAAPVIASASPAGPLGGMLVNIAVDAIKSAHASGKPNDQKKADVMKAIQDAAPAIAKLFPSVVPDPAHLSEGASSIVEGILSIMKATGDLPKKPTPIVSSPVEPIPASGTVLSPIPATCFVSGVPTDGEISISLVFKERS